MTIALVVSVAKQGAIAGVTTTGIDTTGCDLLVANIFWSNGSKPTALVTDSVGINSNTWTPAPKRNASDAANRFYWCQPTHVGSGHTFTIGPPNVYGGIIVMGFSGVKVSSPLDQENGANSSSTAALHTGSVTPTEDNELVIFAATTAGNINSVDAGTLEEVANGIGGVTYGGGVGYVIQTTAAAINPEFSASVTSQMAASILTFKAEPAAGGGGHPYIKRAGGVPGMAINRGVW